MEHRVLAVHDPLLKKTAESSGELEQEGVVVTVNDGRAAHCAGW